MIFDRPCIQSGLKQPHSAMGFSAVSQLQIELDFCLQKNAETPKKSIEASRKEEDYQLSLMGVGRQRIISIPSSASVEIEKKIRNRKRNNR